MLRKVQVSLVIIFSLLVFTSCSSSKGFSSSKEQIKLSGNPTTGYTWVYDNSDESVISVTEKISYTGDDDVVGAPSTYVYTITSKKPGTAILTFEYKRTWEEIPAEQVLKYKITVNDNGKTSIQQN